MKKIYTMIAAVAVVFAANAQNRAMVPSSNGIQSTTHSYKLMPNASRAAGDTLMWFTTGALFAANATDAANFQEYLRISMDYHRIMLAFLWTLKQFIQLTQI